jgi:superfamily II DNA/RNA helicase
VPIDLTAEQRECDAVFHGLEPVLARIGKLRILLERFKLPTVVELIQQLDVEDKVIVFCEFTDSVETIGAACEAVGIEAVTLIGSDSMSNPQKAIDRF